MQRRFVACFRDVATHVIAVYKTVFVVTEFIVDHKTQTNVRFERITIVLTMFLMFLPQRPCGTFWIVNTMELRMQIFK